ncbi:hypothetical protein RINTHM_11390 [Richelia intracellularis HM01]|uniref:hypothetical protein n=1 Tax=Richelia intracellularis TaxID=1164990 RepID=UPI0002B51285|nr:hypothetical protein [Richelia intracellularis]CCH65599.1 hypothetical protein RINTHM_11390 [Richelia intracellularis HM01]
MRHALVSHFRGTFAGVCLGDFLANGYGYSLNRKFSHYQLLLKVTQLLIGQGKFDLKLWQESLQEEYLCLDNSLTSLYQVILATLPIALTFHDNFIKLRRNVLGLLEVLRVKIFWRDVTLAFSYIVAQAVRENICPETVIRETIYFIGDISNNNLSQQLLKLDFLLKQGAGLNRIKIELDKLEQSDAMIVMVFYSYLVAPEDFRLAVLHSLQTGNSPLIVTLVSALSGTANGVLGIPATWRASLLSSNLSRLQHSQYLQMLTLADGLLEQWSGLYKLNSYQTELISDGFILLNENAFSSQVVADPNIIR